MGCEYVATYGIWFNWVVQICGLFSLGKSQSSCIHVKDLEINFCFETGFIISHDFCLNMW